MITHFTPKNCSSDDWSLITPLESRFIRQDNSWGRFSISSELFRRVFAHLDVFPPFLDFVHAFGFKVGEYDENFGGYHRRIYRHANADGGPNSFGELWLLSRTPPVPLLVAELLIIFNVKNLLTISASLKMGFGEPLVGPTYGCVPPIWRREKIVQLDSSPPFCGSSSTARKSGFWSCLPWTGWSKISTSHLLVEHGEKLERLCQLLGKWVQSLGMYISMTCIVTGATHAVFTNDLTLCSKRRKRPCFPGLAAKGVLTMTLRLPMYKNSNTSARW